MGGESGPVIPWVKTVWLILSNKQQQKSFLNDSSFPQRDGPGGLYLHRIGSSMGWRRHEYSGFFKS